MAITKIGSTVAATKSFSTTITQSYTVPSHTKGLLVVDVFISNDSDTDSGVTFNGDALTQLFSKTYGKGTEDMRVARYYLVNPDIGTFDVVATFNDTSSGYRIVITCWDGVDQSSPVHIDADTGESSSGQPNRTITPTIDGCLLMDCMMHESSSALTIPSGTTQLDNHDYGVRVGGSTYVIQTTAAAKQFAWSGGSDAWIQGLTAFKADAGVTEVTKTFSVASLLRKKSTKTFSAPGLLLGWYNTSWNARRIVTVDKDLVGGALTNYAYPLDLSQLNATDFFSKVKSDGGDIRVTLADGVTECAIEVEGIDTGAETGIVWVKAPNLKSDSDTHFYVYYDNPSASMYAVTDTYGRNAVWSNGFLGVYHMSQDPSGSAPQMTDSTGNGNNGTANNMEAGDSVAAKLGKGLDFDGTDTEDISISGRFGNPAAVTIQAWANKDTTNSQAEIMSIDDRVALRHNADGSGAEGFYDTGAGWVGIGTGADSWSQAWHLFHYCVTAGEQRIYVDGQQENSATNAAAISYGGGNTHIAAHGSGSGYSFDGKIDEVRVSSVVRSAAWILTDYNSMNNPAAFAAIGAEETRATVVTKTHSIQARLKLRSTKTHSVAALLRATELLTHNVAALAAILGTAEADVTARLWARYLKTHDIRALLRATYSLEASVDALIYAAQTLEHDVAGRLIKAQEKTHVVNALLRLTALRETVVAAKLIAEQEVTTSVAAKLRKSPVKTAAVDALLRATFEKSTAINALLLATGELSFTIAGLVKHVVELEHEIAALTRLETVKSADIAALLLARITKTHDVDAKLVASQSRNMIVAALVRLQAEKETAVAALLRAMQTAEYAVAGKVSLESVKTHDLAALLLLQNDETVDVTARLWLRTFVSHAVTGKAVRSDTKVTDVAALLKVRIELEHSLAALLRQSTEQTHDIAAKLAYSATKSHAVGALLRAYGLAETTVAGRIRKSRVLQYAVAGLLAIARESIILHDETVEVNDILAALLLEISDIFVDEVAEINDEEENAPELSDQLWHETIEVSDVVDEGTTEL